MPSSADDWEPRMRRDREEEELQMRRLRRDAGQDLGHERMGSGGAVRPSERDEREDGDASERAGSIGGGSLSP